MSDPLLDAHRLLPQFFLLGSPLQPISIRDQMLRARWVVDRFASSSRSRHSEPEIPRIERTRVLVVGAGAAGATAAVRAAELGAKVLLVEQNGGAFGVQARSTTRWIDPVQYDWPASHWNKACYHWRPPAMPFRFKANYSDQLAFRWDVLLHAHIASLKPRLSYQRNLRVTGVWKLGPHLSVDLTRGPRTITRQFDVIFWAVGFGMETTEIDEVDANQNRTGGKIQSPPFWSTDTLEESFCGSNSPPKVLILGSGDGALQDFLRAAVVFPRQNGRKVEVSAVKIYSALCIPEEYRIWAHDIEAEFHRAFVWCDRDDDERKIHQARHSAYEALIDELWRGADFCDRAKSLLRNDIASITIAYPGTCFTAFYGLNCFLSQIVGRAWAEQHQLPIAEVLRGGLRTKYGCRIQDGSYRVTLESQPPASLTRDCDVLIIRFGIDATSTRVPMWLPHRLPASVRPRHLFGFHLPA